MRASQILLKLLIEAFGLSGELVIGFDETIERRRGEQIKAKGIYRDAVRSSKSFFVKCVPRGLRWLCFALLTEIPFAKKVWALPFLTILCPSARYHEERGMRHRKLPERARARDSFNQKMVANLRFSVCRRRRVCRDRFVKCGQRGSHGGFQTQIGCGFVSESEGAKKRTTRTRTQKRQAITDFASHYC